MNYDLDTAEGLKNAVDWQTNMCSMLEEGGMWAVPRSNAIYTIYQSKKVAVRDTADEAVDLIFKEMGYEVKEVK